VCNPAKVDRETTGLTNASLTLRTHDSNRRDKLVTSPLARAAGSCKERARAGSGTEKRWRIYRPFPVFKSASRQHQAAPVRSGRRWVAARRRLCSDKYADMDAEKSPSAISKKKDLGLADYEEAIVATTKKAYEAKRREELKFQEKTGADKENVRSRARREAEKYALDDLVKNRETYRLQHEEQKVKESLPEMTVIFPPLAPLPGEGGNFYTVKQGRRLMIWDPYLVEVQCAKRTTAAAAGPGQAADDAVAAGAGQAADDAVAAGAGQAADDAVAAGAGRAAAARAGKASKLTVEFRYVHYITGRPDPILGVLKKEIAPTRRFAEESDRSMRFNAVKEATLDAMCWKNYYARRALFIESDSSLWDFNEDASTVKVEVFLKYPSPGTEGAAPSFELMDMGMQSIIKLTASLEPFSPLASRLGLIHAMMSEQQRIVYDNAISSSNQGLALAEGSASEQGWGLAVSGTTTSAGSQPSEESGRGLMASSSTSTASAASSSTEISVVQKPTSPQRGGGDVSSQWISSPPGAQRAASSSSSIDTPHKGVGDAGSATAGGPTTPAEPSVGALFTSSGASSIAGSSRDTTPEQVEHPRAVISRDVTPVIRECKRVLGALKGYSMNEFVNRPTREGEESRLSDLFLPSLVLLVDCIPQVQVPEIEEGIAREELRHCCQLALDLLEDGLCGIQSHFVQPIVDVLTRKLRESAEVRRNVLLHPEEMYDSCISCMYHLCKLTEKVPADHKNAIRFFVDNGGIAAIAICFNDEGGRYLTQSSGFGARQALTLLKISMEVDKAAVLAHKDALTAGCRRLFSLSLKEEKKGRESMYRAASVLANELFFKKEW
jgi:hypothetical protein